jgi:hypothetical protein
MWSKYKSHTRDDIHIFHNLFCFPKDFFGSTLDDGCGGVGPRRLLSEPLEKDVDVRDI